MSKITHRKFWSGTLREERCGITVISTKLLIVNYQIKNFWDFSIQTANRLEYNKPNVVVYTKVDKEITVIDPACPFDTRIEEKL